MKWQVTETKRIENRYGEGESYVETEINVPAYVAKKFQSILNTEDHGYALVEVEGNTAVFAGLDLDLDNGFTHHWEMIVADFEVAGIQGLYSKIKITRPSGRKDRDGENHA